MTFVYSLVRPMLMALPAETAHGLTILALRLGGGRFFPRPAPDPALATEVFGLHFPNPLGLAAGFDKDAEVPDAMLALGFGFTETGTVTPLPQQGNPRPRLFRLSKDRAIINRMGFNNQGVGATKARLSARGRQGFVGANVGANKDSTDRIADYGVCMKALAGQADYFVINVSSPNTPGLRALQSREPLMEIIASAKDALSATHGAPLLLKVSPDLGPEDRAEVAAASIESGIDGLIISNTTLARPDTLTSPNRIEEGGLSGAPLMESATRALGEFYHLTSGQIPLIGVGGISSGADAYQKICQGASLVQLYSALVYGGPGLIAEILADLSRLLKADGYENISEAVGADHPL